ncbi:dipeptidase [Acetobacteroides hydrogenigenes]|uniref:Dipeptidase n=1 Tax=Acetobacteroides hydrogenigenes TaxID=979970 RepID=A0A4R2E3B6_9BACT|nr:C69 family dipeptidase [Acetobacteroides hydrogenigenes]TCN62061.1 dipeptidase [Acetobacteroides hydrogenigenes]
MKRSFKGIVLLSLGILTGIGAFAQPDDPYFGETCTSILVGKKASADKSVITSHTCDGSYRTWLNVVPAATYPDTAKHLVYKGSLKTESVTDNNGLTLAGSIPQVNQTFAYLNTAYPCLNEKQLAIGETTIVGRKELVNEKGMFNIEELQRIALQRCTSARQAIKLIGELVKQYGYGDWGECITIADKNEVWQFEIFGEGPDRIGGVWAAQRIPDDHVGISANIARIGEIDLSNPNYFMASDNVQEVALRLKLWDGTTPFKFWKAYSQAKKNFTIRDFFVLSSFAPSLNLKFDADEIPFSVKPEKKVSVQDVFALYRTTYEGTFYDMTKNLKVVKTTYKKDGSVEKVDTVLYEGANPWMGRDEAAIYNALKPGSVEFQRTVSVAWCSYSEVIQLRDWLPDEVGGVAWFSFDNPGQSPRLPIYSGNLSLPDSYSICGQHRYREDAAIWSFRKANKLATVKWQKTRKTIETEVAALEAKALAEQPALEEQVKDLVKKGKNKEARELVTRYSNDFSRSAMQRWTELERSFWGLFGRGF